MKLKISNCIVFITIIVAFFSCDEGVDYNQHDVCQNAQLINDCKQPNRSTSEAIDIALDAWSMIATKKSRAQIAISESDIRIIGNPRCRSGAIDTTMYIVNYPNNSGYAVIAANKNITGLLAVTENGHYYSMDSVSNPGMRMFLDAATKYSLSAPKAITIDPLPIWYQSQDTVEHWTKQQEPRIKNCLGQGYPFGQFCPNGVTGCVPLAGATALSYIEIPYSIQLTYPNHSANSVQFDWSDIKNGHQIEPFSHLCREIGHQINADYVQGTYPDYRPHTDAITAVLCSYMKQLIGNSHVSDFKSDFTKAYDIIRDNGVIIMRGEEAVRDDIHSGHAWIMDGYKYEYIKIDNYV